MSQCQPGHALHSTDPETAEAGPGPPGHRPPTLGSGADTAIH